MMNDATSTPQASGYEDTEKLKCECVSAASMTPGYSHAVVPICPGFLAYFENFLLTARNRGVQGVYKMVLLQVKDYLFIPYRHHHCTVSSCCFSNPTDLTGFASHHIAFLPTMVSKTFNCEAVLFDMVCVHSTSGALARICSWAANTRSVWTGRYSHRLHRSRRSRLG